MDPTSKKCLTRDQIAARLRNPPKKNLDELRWRLARPHLIELVAAMQPINAAAAVRFHSHLCDRLRRGRWVPDQAPDWAQLLSDDAVAAHADAQAQERCAHSLIANHQATLRRAQRALRGEAPDSRSRRTGHGDADGPQHAPRGTVRPAVRLSPAAVILAGLVAAVEPVAVMAAVLAPWAALTHDRLDRLLPMAACGVNGALVNLPDVVVRELQCLTPPVVLEVAMAQKRTSPQPPAAGKIPSRAALRRAAHAELARLQSQELLLDTSAPLPAALPVPGDIAKRILEWQPQKHNRLTRDEVAPVRELLVRLVLASGPASTAKASRLCLHMAGFLVWAGGRHEGGARRLAADDLWDERLRHKYHAHQTSAAGGGVPVSSADTARSEIRWVLTRARPGAERHPVPERVITPPYSTADAQRLVRHARNQPTPALRRTLSIVVSLTLGAGLSGEDLRHVRRRDVRELTTRDGLTVLVVTVHHPERAREVVVLSAYSPLLREALSLHDKSRLGLAALLLGEKTDRKNITGPIKARAQTGSGEDLDLDIGRMRKHWLVTLMTARVPLRVLLDCAGLASTRALTDLLPFVPVPDLDVVHQLITQAVDECSSPAPSTPQATAPERSRPPARPGTEATTATGPSPLAGPPPCPEHPERAGPPARTDSRAALRPRHAVTVRVGATTPADGRTNGAVAGAGAARCREGPPLATRPPRHGPERLNERRLRWPAHHGPTDLRATDAHNREGRRREAHFNSKDKTMFRQDTVERVVLIHERGGAIPIIEAVLSPTGTGRKGLSVLAWCVAQDLLASRGSSLTHKNIVNLLNLEITNTSKALLGLKQDSRGRFELVTRRQVEQISSQLAKRLSYLPGSTGGLSDDERRGRRATLEMILDCVIDGSKPLDLTPSGHYALDGSGIHAWSRRPGWGAAQGGGGEQETSSGSPDGDDSEIGETTAMADQPAPPAMFDGPRQSKDTDAKFGYKTAKSGEKELFFGYDLYPMVRVRAENDKSDHPHLVERFRMQPASSDEPDSTLPLIEQMHLAPVDVHNPLSVEERVGKGRYPVLQLLTDRAWSYKTADRWADRLRAMAIEQVVDLHQNDHGVRDHEGMRIVAGWAHCPAMPDELIDIKRPARLALTPEITVDVATDDMTPAELTSAQRETVEFMAAIAERNKWAMIRMANGKRGERVMCPAREMKISCPLIALSDTEAVRNSGIPRVQNPPAPEGQPRCCTQATVEVPWTVTPKVRQTHYWGSLKWIKSFARRTHVEGVFGNVKNRNCENLARGWLQTPGLVRTSIAMSFVLAAYNRRISQAWNERTGASADPAFRPAPPFRGYIEITDDGEQQAA